MVTSFGVAALIGAAQLGVGQALSIVDIGKDVTAPGSDAHARLDTWLVIVFAGAVLGGAALGRRSIRRRISIVTRQVPTVMTMSERVRSAAVAARGPLALATARTAVAFFAGLGAATSFPLVWISARSATGRSAGVGELAAMAGVGVALGVVFAVLGLALSPVGAGLAVTVAWVWMAGLASVLLALTQNQPVVTPHLAVLETPGPSISTQWWLGPYLMVAIGAVLGLVLAGATRWIGASKLGIALSGVVGPALVAAAYISAALAPHGLGVSQTSPYQASILAATAGLLASAAVASTQPSRERPAVPVNQRILVAGTVTGPAGVPATIAGAEPTSAGGIYLPRPRQAPLVPESRVARAQPPRRVDSRAYIDGEVTAEAEAAARKAHADAAQRADADATARRARAQAQKAEAEAQARRTAEVKDAAVRQAQAVREAEAARKAAEAEAARKTEQARQAKTRRDAEAARQAKLVQESETIRLVEQKQAVEAAAKAKAEADALAAAQAKAAAEARAAEEARAAQAQALEQEAKEKKPPKRRERRQLAKAEKLAAERAAAEKVVAAKAEAARIKAEAARAKADKIEAERAEAERLKAEKARARGKDELRKGEKEHVDWVTNLVNLPHDPELETRKF
jgi:hypothetical protein